MQWFRVPSKDEPFRRGTILRLRCGIEAHCRRSRIKEWHKQQVSSSLACTELIDKQPMRSILTARIRKLLNDLSDTFWLVPGLMVLAGVLAAVGFVHLDRSGIVPQWLLDGPWFYNGGATGARTLLGAVASSTIGVAGTVPALFVPDQSTMPERRRPSGRRRRALPQGRPQPLRLVDGAGGARRAATAAARTSARS